MSFLLSTLPTGSLACAQSKAADSKCKPGVKTAGCSGKDSSTPTRNTGSDAAPAGAAFPFPTEDSKRGSAEAAPTAPGQNGLPAPAQNGLPSMPTDAVPDPPASSERPLKLPPDDRASSSSSGSDTPPGASASSSSRTTEDDDVAPTAAAPDAPVKSSALKDLGSRGDTSAARAKLEQTRVSDDLKVGSFYRKDGNIQGAYLRYKDAAEHAPDDPEAHFFLAEAAQKLNKRDEAVMNYTACLRLDPGGDHDKDARKALARLGAGPQ